MQAFFTRGLFLFILLFTAILSNAQIIFLKAQDALIKPKIQLFDSAFNLINTFSSNPFNINEIYKNNKKLFIYTPDYDTISIKLPISLNYSDTFYCNLIPNSSLLNTIILSASKTQQKFRDIPISIETIKPYIFTNKNTTELNDAINQIPAVNVIDGQASIRGGSGWSYGSGSKVMVTVNGMPAISGDANQIQWKFLDLENIKSIEVIKGASSVLYGSSALNGVINITTNKPTEKLKGRISTFSGMYSKPGNDSLNWSNRNLMKSGASGYIAFKKRKFDFAGSFLTLIDDGYRMAEKDSRFRLSLELGYQLNKKLYIGLNMAGMYTNGSTFLLWESAGYGYTALDSSFNINKVNRLALDPYINYQGNSIEHNLQYRYFNLDNNIYENNVLSNQSNASSLNYLEYRGKLKKMPLNLITTFGAVASFSQTNSPLFQGVQRAENRAGFIQIDRRFGKFYGSIGARYEYFALNDINEEKPVFKAGVTYELKKTTILRASYGEGFRFPSIAESYISTRVGSLVIYPNIDLKSEQAFNLELGIKQGLKIKKVNAYIDVAAFYSEINNMMEFTFARWTLSNDAADLFGFGFKSVNTGAAMIKGIDASIAGVSKHTFGDFSFLLGYNYNDARSLTPNKVFILDSQGIELSYLSTSSDTLNYFLKYRSRHNFKADIQFDKKGWSVGLSARYNSFIENIDKAFVSFPINLFITGIQNRRMLQNKGNLIFDVRLSKTFKENYKINLICNNLLNQIVMERPADLRPPRFVSLQVVVLF